MILYGLTGSIGMGKSTAAKLLRSMSIPVFDSDASVHALLEKGGAGVAPVLDAFPDCVGEHGIDRKKLGRIVFNDGAARKRLEGILHPLVRQAADRFIKKMERLDVPCAVLDIPLLFESGWDRRVDYTIVVSAPAFLQRQRVLSRAGMSEELFEKILESQMPDEEKCQRADFIVPTGLGRAYSYRVLKNIMVDNRCHAPNLC